jgi:acetyl esterase
MPLKPEVQDVLDLIASMPATPITELQPEELRANFRALVAPSTESVASVDDLVVDGPDASFGMRVYRPQGSGADDVLPVLVWFHGGGFVIGDLDTADSQCRALANGARAVVVSVDYRLAPEHPFPAAVDDAFEALRWVVGRAAELRIDPSAVAVGGDSAGGNLAAVVAQMAKAAGGPDVAFQLLVYPVTDWRMDTASHTENADGYFLTHEIMVWFREHYLGGRDGANPRVSPAAATDLSGLPRALVITAEFDPLRDEGEAYAAQLAAAGVSVEQIRYDGEIHGFFGMDGLPDAADARRRAAVALAEAFAGAGTGRR